MNPILRLVRLGLAPALFLILTSSCGTQYITPSKITGEWERKIEKNYHLGQLRTVPVGEVMVSQKDFYFREVLSDTVEASNDCIVFRSAALQAGTDSFSYAKGEKYRVHSNVFHEGVRIRLIGHSKFPTQPIVGISPSGEVTRWDGILRTLYVEPKHTRFLSASTREIDITRGYLNFEIVYTGKSGGAINLIYREYSKEDIARTAFFQNLSYDASVSVIAFKSIKMEIVSATNESISFYVRAD